MKVYLTYRNSDLTEGRGPMVADACFSTRAVAASYIDALPGVMGRRQKWSQEEYGDWEIREIEVHDSIAELGKSRKAEIKKKALAKLGEEEKKALGLI